MYNDCDTDEKSGGTQIKMTMQFDNGMLALAKPMRSVFIAQVKPNQLFIHES